MYNRYIPGSNGVYERQLVQEPPKKEHTEGRIKPVQQPNVLKEESRPKHHSTASASPLPVGLDAGDLLLLCIILLIIIDSEQDDLSGILLTAAAFLFLQ